MLNPFFKNTGPHSIEKLLNKIDFQNKENFKKDKIYDVKDLSSASKRDLTFFHSKNYSSLASNTKAFYCVTTDSLSQFLPNSCKKIILLWHQIQKLFIALQRTASLNSYLIHVKKLL